MFGYIKLVNISYSPILALFASLLCIIFGRIIWHILQVGEQTSMSMSQQVVKLKENMQAQQVELKKAEEEMAEMREESAERIKVSKLHVSSKQAS